MNYAEKQIILYSQRVTVIVGSAVPRSSVASACARHEVDLIENTGPTLQTFEIVWSTRKTSGRALRDAYGVDVRTIRPDNPFIESIVEFG